MANPTRSVSAHLAEHEDDDHARQRGYIKGTDFALPYFSQWSRAHDTEAGSGLLRHINCGYLSTHGVPPTLLALKQHAQSLCILIHALNPTLHSGEIGIGNSPSKAGSSSSSKKKKGQKASSAASSDPLDLRYALNDAFDFLTDLSTPYTNDDPAHNLPLLALSNEVAARSETTATTTYHCPFASLPAPREKGAPQKPHANHHSLIMHANACLERLDHEFSSTGGLLSLLPPADPNSPTPTPTPQNNNPNRPTPHPNPHIWPSPPPNPSLTAARKSLLGQWLAFTQSLVARTHDLERAYGNALDVLAGEAAVPWQALSEMGPDGRATGREVVFPQDRWVLANAGGEVHGFVHGLLDREEAVQQGRERVFAGDGVGGRGMWVGGEGGEGEQDGEGGDGDDAVARGVVWVDVKTRYYRLAGGGRGTVFVLPAWEHHPGVGFTRELEGKPTVVACVQPKFPVRATELEKRYTEKLDWAQKVEVESLKMRDRLGEKSAEVRVLRSQNEMLAATRDALMLAVGEDGSDLARMVHEQRERAGKAEKEAREAASERDAAVARAERLREGLEQRMRELAVLRGKKVGE